MYVHWVVAAMFAWAVACGSGGTAGGEMQVREGIASLEKHVEVPAVLHDVRWVARAKGAGSSPGPTDLELLAWFPVPDANRDAVFAAIGAPSDAAAQEVTVPATLADPLTDLVPAERRGDRVVLRGTPIPPDGFQNIRWQAAFVIAVPGGIVAYLHSR